jgi:hypothetical protein
VFSIPRFDPPSFVGLILNIDLVTVTISLGIAMTDGNVKTCIRGDGTLDVACVVLFCPVPRVLEMGWDDEREVDCGVRVDGVHL